MEKSKNWQAKPPRTGVPHPIHYDLEIWQEAMRLAREVYRLTATLPADERFGLTLQMRRAAVSVASNIAEGAGRGRSKEWVQFLLIARGSLLELDTQLWLAQDLQLVAPSAIPRKELERLIAKLNAFITLKRQKSV